MSDLSIGQKRRGMVALVAVLAAFLGLGVAACRNGQPAAVRVVGRHLAARYLLELAPHADERLCPLLISRQAIRMVVPRLNQGGIAAHTDVELVG